MSENNTENKKEDNKKKQLNYFIWFMLGLIAGIAVGYGVLASGLTQAVKDNKVGSIESNYVAEIESGDASGISTYSSEHTELTGDKLNEAKTEVISAIDEIKNNNVYMQLSISDTNKEIYLYNKNGECYAQNYDTGSSVVFRNDGVAISLNNKTNKLTVMEDVDSVTIAENAIKNVGEVEGMRLLEMELSQDIIDSYNNDDNDIKVIDAKEYRVDVVGDEAFKACYSSIEDDKAANSVLKGLKETIGDDWQTHIIFVYNLVYLDDGNRNIGMCALYVVKNDDGEYEEQTDWLLDGAIEIGEWKLPEKWYTTDYEAETSDNLLNMIDELEAYMCDILDEFAKEHNIDIDSEIEVEDELDDTSNSSDSSSDEEQTSSNKIYGDEEVIAEGGPVGEDGTLIRLDDIENTED